VKAHISLTTKSDTRRTALPGRLLQGARAVASESKYESRGLGPAERVTARPAGPAGEPGSAQGRPPARPGVAGPGGPPAGQTRPSCLSTSPASHVQGTRYVIVRLELRGNPAQLPVAARATAACGGGGSGCSGCGDVRDSMSRLISPF
jgi:hypothetical protein